MRKKKFIAASLLFAIVSSSNENLFIKLDDKNFFHYFKIEGETLAVHEDYTEILTDDITNPIPEDFAYGCPQAHPFICTFTFEITEDNPISGCIADYNSNNKYVWGEKKIREAKCEELTGKHLNVEEEGKGEDSKEKTGEKTDSKEKGGEGTGTKKKGGEGTEGTDTKKKEGDGKVNQGESIKEGDCSLSNFFCNRWVLCFIFLLTGGGIGYLVKTKFPGEAAEGKNADEEGDDPDPEDGPLVVHGFEVDADGRCYDEEEGQWYVLHGGQWYEEEDEDGKDAKEKDSPEGDDRDTNENMNSLSINDYDVETHSLEQVREDEE